MGQGGPGGGNLLDFASKGNIPKRKHSFYKLIKGKMIYEGYGELVIIEGALDTLYIFHFLANGSTNLDVFQPKTNEKSSLKISAHQVQSFRRSQGTNKQINRQIHSLTDILSLLQSVNTMHYLKENNIPIPVVLICLV